MLALNGAGFRVGERWLWRGVTFTLASGASLALRGASGSGKSLLLRALIGLETLDEGSVTLDGRALDAWHLPALRAEVAYLPQRAALVEGTVEDNLRRPYVLAVHAEREYSAGAARRLLAALGRDAAMLAQPVANLSGGERQVVALARTLQLEPRILLLDEATASLDPEATASAEALVVEWLRADERRAVIWTSHDPAQLERVSTRSIKLGPSP